MKTTIQEASTTPSTERFTKQITGHNSIICALAFLLVKDARDFIAMDSGTTLVVTESSVAWLRSQGVKF